MNEYRKTGIVLQKADGLKMACHQAAVVERRSTIYEAQDILGVTHTTLRSQLDPNQTKSIPLGHRAGAANGSPRPGIERSCLAVALGGANLDCLSIAATRQEMRRAHPPGPPQQYIPGLRTTDSPHERKEL